MHHTYAAPQESMSVLENKNILVGCDYLSSLFPKKKKKKKEGGHNYHSNHFQIPLLDLNSTL